MIFTTRPSTFETVPMMPHVVLILSSRLNGPVRTLQTLFFVTFFVVPAESIFTVT